MNGFDSPEETTSTGKLRALRAPHIAEAPADLHVAVGQLMAAVARTERKVDELSPLASEVAGLRRDIELDRDHLVVGASSRAAKHSSNRMAALVAGLFVVYEQAAPVLHALWKGLHQ